MCHTCVTFIIIIGSGGGGSSSSSSSSSSSNSSSNINKKKITFTLDNLHFIRCVVSNIFREHHDGEEQHFLRGRRWAGVGSAGVGVAGVGRTDIDDTNLGEEGVGRRARGVWSGVDGRQV